MTSLQYRLNRCSTNNCQNNRFLYEIGWVGTHSEQIGKWKLILRMITGFKWFFSNMKAGKAMLQETTEEWSSRYPNSTLRYSHEMWCEESNLTYLRYPYHVFGRDEVYLLFWGRSVRYGRNLSSETRLLMKIQDGNQLRDERAVSWWKSPKYTNTQQDLALPRSERYSRNVGPRGLRKEVGNEIWRIGNEMDQIHRIGTPSWKND